MTWNNQRLAHFADTRAINLPKQSENGGFLAHNARLQAGCVQQEKMLYLPGIGGLLILKFTRTLTAMIVCFGLTRIIALTVVQKLKNSAGDSRH